MSRILHTLRPARWALLTTVLAGLLVPGAASAAAGSEIEGVWEFSKGAVDVRAAPGGSEYEGIVTVQTEFASCPHMVEEQIWTKITLQPEGYYTGLHQWFHGDCTPNTTLGPTAWRVLKEASGASYLLVCFSNPGSGQQPTISAEGAPKGPSEYAAHHVTYNCQTAKRLASLPVVQNTPGPTPGPTPGSTSGSTAEVESLTLPSAKQCLRPGSFKIHLKEPKFDPFKTVTVLFKGHKLATTHKGNEVIATLNLKGAKSAFTVKVNAVTVLGHKLTAKRTYRICKSKAKHHGKHKHG